MKLKKISGVLFLSVCAFIAKILSAFYRVPFENMVGDVGFYVYQQVYPIYGIAMVLALNGLPLFISKLVVEKNSNEAKHDLVKKVFVILSFFSGIIFLILKLGKNEIAYLMGDTSLSMVIDGVSWVFLFVPILAIGRGYYQGTLNMVPTGISQILEQLVRISVILLAAFLFVKNHWSYYKMGYWAMMGSSFGVIASSLIFVKFYLTGFFSKAISLKSSYKKLIRRFLGEGLAICLFASIMILMQLVDSFTVKQALQINFDANFAKQFKGIYDRSQPLVQLGLIVSASLTSTLLPNLTLAVSQNKMLKFKKLSSSFMKINLAFASATTLGLIILMPQINSLLFGNEKESLTISVYIISVLIVSIINTYNALLQSFNNYKSVVKGMLVAILLKGLFNYYFVMHFGVLGASLTTVFALLAASLIVLIKLPKTLKNLIGFTFIKKLILVLVLMSIFTKLSMVFFEVFSSDGRILNGLLVFLSVGVGVLTFLISSVFFRLFSINEWTMITGGMKFIKLYEKIRRRYEIR